MRRRRRDGEIGRERRYSTFHLGEVHSCRTICLPHKSVTVPHIPAICCIYQFPIPKQQTTNNKQPITNSKSFPPKPLASLVLVEKLIV